jgi:hypothetical protein
MLQQVQHMVWEQAVVVYLKAIFQTAKMLPYHNLNLKSLFYRGRS